MGSIQKIIFSATVLLCVLFQILPVFRSGQHYSYGIGFWGPNGHDAVWHLSLINHINNPFIINQPSYSGESLKNYHPFYDIFVSYLSKILFLPPSLINFQILPIVTATIISLISFKIVFSLTGNFFLGLFAVFLNTFSNSFGPLYNFLSGNSFSGESLFWSMQPPSFQLNPPLVIALIMFLFIILSTVTSFKSSFLVFIFLSLLPITKVYVGVGCFFYYFLYSLYSINKKNTLPLRIFILSSVTALSLFLLYNHSPNGLLEIKPFWLVESLYSSPDRVYIPKLSSALYNLKPQGIYNLKYIILVFLSTLFFLIGNFSFRILSIFSFFKKSNFNIYNHLFLYTVLFLIFLSLFLVQKSTPWNTIQFLYPALILSNFSLCFLLSKLNNRYLFILLILFIVPYYLLCSFENIKNYFGNPSPSALTLEEINSLIFLNLQPSGIVLTYPYSQYTKEKYTKTPVPLYAYETTAYLSAFTKHITYLSDEMNLQNSGYDVASRRKSSLKFFDQKNIFQDRGFLVNNKIDYIYLYGFPKKEIFLSKDLFIENIYESPESIIYKVQR